MFGILNRDIIKKEQEYKQKGIYKRYDEIAAELKYEELSTQINLIMTLDLDVHSPNFNTIKELYDKRFWNEEMVQEMLNNFWITNEEYFEIINN